MPEGNLSGLDGRVAAVLNVIAWQETETDRSPAGRSVGAVTAAQRARDGAAQAGSPRPNLGAALSTDRARGATAGAAASARPRLVHRQGKGGYGGASDMSGPVRRQGGRGHGRPRGQHGAQPRPLSGQGRPHPVPWPTICVALSTIGAGEATPGATAYAVHGPVQRQGRGSHSRRHGQCAVGVGIPPRMPNFLIKLNLLIGTS